MVRVTDPKAGMHYPADTNPAPARTIQKVPPSYAAETLTERQWKDEAEWGRGGTPTKLQKKKKALAQLAAAKAQYASTEEASAARAVKPPSDLHKAANSSAAHTMARTHNTCKSGGDIISQATSSDVVACRRHLGLVVSSRQLKF